MRFRTVMLVGLFATSAAVQGATIVDITGPSPFGFANQQVEVQAWNQSATYSNVSISMPLEDNTQGGPIAGVEGVIYLMNQVGAGTTAANEVAPPVSISGLTASFTPRTLWTGLTLPPGNYYLVMASTQTNPLSMSGEGSSNPVVTAGAGITDLGNDAALTPAAYPPATTGLSLHKPSNIFMTVTGDFVGFAAAPNIPTLSLALLCALAVSLAGATFVSLRRRRFR